MVEKYIKIYLKRNLVLSLICAKLVFLPLFVVSLIYDILDYDIIVAFVPFPLALLCVVICALPIIRFRKMITRQESLYHTRFSDDGLIHLGTTLYLSKDWLIWAGSCAIHKKHIQSITYKLVTSGVGSSNKITISTLDHKRYVVWSMSTTDIKKIKEWRRS